MKKVKWLMFISFICVMGQVFPAEKTKWWNENWEYRLTITVQNPSATATEQRACCHDRRIFYGQGRYYE